jgi:dihydroxyacetone kinase-like protein
MITVTQLPELFSAISEQMNAHADELGDLDAAMGDGDLGLTMRKGFAALTDPGIAADATDIGKALAKYGMKLSSAVPSTMGTLLASGLLSAGKALVGRREIDESGLRTFYDQFAAGIAARGKAAEGQRTVLDALFPAARAAAGAAPDASLAQIASAALQGAEAGVEATKTMVPVWGKAAVHLDKASGVPDQGALAGLFLLTGIVEFLSR